jgi:predicted phage-related endonuclease
MLTQWHAERRAGLSSSDLAAILGRNPRRSPAMVQREKLHEVEDPDVRPPTEDQWWGTAMEPMVAYTFWAPRLPLAEIRGLDNGGQTKWMAYRKGAEILRTTPDYLIELPDAPDAMVEVKTTGRDRAWADGPPLAVRLQLQWHLLCTGLRVGYVVVLLFAKTRRLRFWRYEIAPELDGPQSIGAQRALAWWQRHVVERKPPVPCSADIPWLTKKHPHGNGTTVVLPAEQATLDTLYLERHAAREEARAAFDRADRPFRDVEAQLRAAIGPASFASIEGLPGVLYTLHSGPKGGRTLRRKQR